MSKKSGKRKSGNGTSTGTTLGALALIIAIGALGLGVYQFMVPSPTTLPSPEEGPRIYYTSNNDVVHFDGITQIKYIPQLNITYSTKVGDTVLLEFNCRIFLESLGGTSFTVYFQDNGSAPTASIYLYSANDIYTTGYMRYLFEASTAGVNYLQIYMFIDDVDSDSFISYSILTVTVY
jgi:hypothetical protein